MSILFDILRELDRAPMGRFELAEKLGCSPQIVGRQIKILRNVFQVKIESSAVYGYELEDWGVFDREAVKARIFSRRKAKPDTSGKAGQ